MCADKKSKKQPTKATVDSRADEKRYMGFYAALRRKVFSQIARKRAPGRELSAREKRLLEVLALLPDMFHLCVKLILDKEVPSQNKGPLIAAVAYVMSPIDLIPDLIPVFGWVDDVLVMALALNRLLDKENPSIDSSIDRYWAGSEDLLETVRHALSTVEAAARFLPNRFLPVIRSILRRR